MKLTKAALAVAAIVGSVAVSAQTANVTLYGYINTSIESNRGTSTVRNAAGQWVQNNALTINRMTSNSSRFGLRGTESLGGGLNAFFQLESGFNSDDGSFPDSAIFGREAWVGLGGGFGQVKLGYGLTPYDDVMGLSHQNIGSTGQQNRNNGLSSGIGFASNQLFSSYNRGGNTVYTTQGNFDARAGNAISYSTPNFAGLTVRTMYSFIEETAASPKASLWDTGAVYSNGPITAGLAYALHKNFQGVGGLSLARHDQTAIRAYGRYNFGVARIDAAYEQMSFKLPATLTGVTGNVGTLKAKYWEIGAQVPLGAFNLGAQYSQRDNGAAWAYNAPTGYTVPTATQLRDYWSIGGGKHWALVADYSFSKRTQFYGYLASMKNETGGKQTTPAIGIIHKF